MPEVDYVGFRISSAGLSPLAHRVEAIVKFPKPTSVRLLRRFLGMLNYYRRFQRGIAGILAPLYRMTKPGHFQWTEESDAAFVATKQAVAEQVTTTFPAINADYSLAVDASDIAVGAMQQRIAATCIFLMHLMKGNNTSQLSIENTLQLPSHMLEGRHFSISLIKLFAIKSSVPRAPLQARQLDFIAQLTTDIQHIAGKDNIIADTLPRIKVDAVTTATIDSRSLDELISAQKSELELQHLKDLQVALPQSAALPF